MSKRCSSVGELIAQASQTTLFVQLIAQKFLRTGIKSKLPSFNARPRVGGIQRNKER